MPIATSDFISWLTTALSWDTTQESGAPILPGPFVPAMPDRVVIASPTPGPGYLLEGDADAAGFQLRVRGPQNNQDAAEALAYDLDRRILRALFPASAGASVLIHVHRLGGAPTPLAPGPDAGRRYEYTTQYVAIAGT